MDGVVALELPVRLEENAENVLWDVPLVEVSCDDRGDVKAELPKRLVEVEPACPGGGELDFENANSDATEEMENGVTPVF